MLKQRGRPSPTTVIACLALFFAVAGGSAMALQGRNSVDSGDLKPNAVKTSDIANNAVTTGKIKNNHVRAADIQANAVGSGEIRNGQVRTADIAPAENVITLGAGQLGTGGENDCIWSTSDPAFPLPFRLGPPGYYKDVLGYVHLTGMLFPIDGPGGDANCGGAAGESSEDGVAFILPPDYRPTNDQIAGAGGGGAIVIGSTPLASPPDFFPAGAVASPSPGSPIILSGIVFEPAGVAGGAPRRDSSVGAQGAGGSLESLADLIG